MKKIAIAFLLMAGCSSQEQGANQQASIGDGATKPRQAAQPAQGTPARLTGISGLYEGGSGDPRHQMCIVSGSGDEQRFGLVVWGSDMHSCSGSGSVTREGDVLKLAMAGDSSCTIRATISGKTVKMPSDLPAGCSYYCGARARLGGAELTQVGTSKADAMKARDLVGEPLCAEDGG